MQLVKSHDDRTLLHIWRTGTAFEFTGRFGMFQEWTNLKFSSIPFPDDPPYIYHAELREPLPFKDNTFDVVYCNHVFEHLTLEDGARLSSEIHRVLKPGGVFRNVVPDLASAAREYLDTLENVLQEPSVENTIRYDWAVADLIDQLVRERSGGMMKELLEAGRVDWDQIKERNGDVFEFIRNHMEENARSGRSKKLQRHLPRNAGDLLPFIQKAWYRARREFIFRFGRRPRVELLNEKNLWMYDQFSLRRLMEAAGFGSVEVLGYNTSRIAGWDRYNFDQSEKGDYPLEPSIYLEGRKPSAI